MWESGRRQGHFGDHQRPQVADRGTPSRVDKRVAPDREGAADKQCQGEGKLWSQYVITNHKEGKGKPPRLFPKTGYPLGYPEPALQQKTEERDRERKLRSQHQKLTSVKMNEQLTFCWSTLRSSSVFCTSKSENQQTNNNNVLPFMETCCWI